MAKDARTSNGYDPDQLDAVVAKIEGVLARLATEKSNHMTACKEILKGKKAALKEAKEAGMDTQALLLQIAQRDSVRKHIKKLDELEADTRAAYDEMTRQLGDFGSTELGAAALDKAKPKGSTTLDSLSQQ